MNVYVVVAVRYGDVSSLELESEIVGGKIARLGEIDLLLILIIVVWVWCCLRCTAVPMTRPSNARTQKSEPDNRCAHPYSQNRRAASIAIFAVMHQSARSRGGHSRSQLVSSATPSSLGWSGRSTSSGATLYGCWAGMSSSTAIDTSEATSSSNAAGSAAK